VTGGGKGLGRAFARHLAAAGEAVVVNNRNRSVDADGRGPADHVADEIAAAGGRAVADTHDVLDDGAGEAMVGLAVERFGRLDCLVTAAAISKPELFHKTTVQRFEEILAVNVAGTARIALACMPVVAALVDPASSLNGQVVVTAGGGLRAVDAVEYATVELGAAPLGPDRLAGLLALSRSGAARAYPDAMSAFSDLASDVTGRR
jgi:NAD(P)-dependent dehydrogenase (short-subunit alcohol dehydrogenase family)